MAKAWRILVVGGGSIGTRHVRCLLRTGRAEVGLCELRDQTREATAAACGITESFASLDHALQAPWDAAVIATPAHTHVPIALRAAEAGLGLLIEKPLAVQFDGVDDLQAAVRLRRLPAAVAYVFRAHPALRAMRDAVTRGRFGRPLQLIAVSGQHFPTYRPAYRQTYYTDHASGGGAIQDALTHLLNAGEWLAGPITRVSADAAHRVLEGVTVEDTVNVIARHGDVLANYSLNQHQAPNETTITLVCEQGTARFELHRHRWRWMSEPDTPWQEEQTGFRERDDWFTQQEVAWLQTLAGEAAPLCSLDEGIQTLRASRAVLASARRRGEPVTIAIADADAAACISTNGRTDGQRARHQQAPAPVVDAAAYAPARLGPATPSAAGRAIGE